MKKRIRCLIPILLLLFILVFSSCHSTRYFPEDGEWYCEELNMQLAFGSDGECYVIQCGQKIPCDCIVNPGSDTLVVLSQDSYSDCYALGELIFSANFVKLNEQELIVFDPETGIEYSFLRDAVPAEPPVFQASSRDIVVHQSQYCKVIEQDLLFYCFFYNNQGDAVRLEGPLTRQPHIEIYDTSLICFSVQAGTGIGTQWGYFYDAAANRFSNVFQSVFDRHGDLVVYAEQGKIVIRDIFDETDYPITFDSFRHPLSPAAEPFVDAAFSADGSAITVTYLTGEDFQQVTDTFTLP